jgi:hypothetical protein
MIKYGNIEDYNNNPPHSVSFMTDIVRTSSVLSEKISTTSQSRKRWRVWTSGSMGVSVWTNMTVWCEITDTHMCMSEQGEGGLGGCGITIHIFFFVLL